MIAKRSLKKKNLARRKHVKSKHPSHSNFRNNLPIIKGINYIVRLGSITDVKDTVTNGGDRIEINTIRGVKNSANKLLMKQCFNKAGVKTADWFTYNATGFVQHNYNIIDRGIMISNLPYPIISKSLYGSRGEGNAKHDTKEELEAWMKGKNLSNYIFEAFFSGVKEYRLHISKNGCFYACRKVLKNETPEDKRWSRHDDNCSWLLETNDSFDKPVNWDNIVSDCVKALKEVGLDCGGFDVKVQSTNTKDGKKRENPEYIIIEVNSAPSFGEGTNEKYLTEVVKLIKDKYINI